MKEPRHWIGVEELNSEYWENAQVQNQRGQEFFEKPLEYVENLSKNDHFARREFLTVMGASLAMASLSCARRPVHKIIPYVVKPEETVIGVSQYYSSTCKECEKACGLVVKTKEGRPIKMEGNPDHPVNKGALCSRGQASVLNLYDPDRLKKAQIHVRSSAQEVALSQAEQQILSRLTPQSRVRILTTPLSGVAAQKITKDFLSGFADAQCIEFDPLEDSNAFQAQELCFGKPYHLNLHFNAAKIVVSLSADFLGSWGNPVQNAKDWAKTRNVESGSFSQLFQFESQLSLTGANADTRVKIRPGDELKIAMALIYELAISQKKVVVPDFFQPILNSYVPQQVARTIGFDPALLSQLASLLWENRSASLILAGGPETQTVEAASLHIAVNYLNFILQNQTKTFDFFAVSGFSRGFLAVYNLISEALMEKIDVLLIHGVNLSYFFGAALQVPLALKKIPLVISLADQLDETALLSDVVIPRSHFLESWSDVQAQPGIFSVVQPAIRPLYESKSYEELIFGWLKKPIVSDWFGYLQNVWKTQVFNAKKTSVSFDLFWESVLRKGFYEITTALEPIIAFRLPALKQISVFSFDLSHAELFLTTFYSPSLAEGKSANNAWLQELPHPITSVTWDNYVSISSGLALKLELKQNDVVHLRSDKGAFELPVLIQPGLHDQVVTVALGYGRKQGGKVAKDIGKNAFDLGFVQNKMSVLSGFTVRIKKTGRVYPLAMTQWHTATQDRPIINDITYNQYKSNPGFLKQTQPALKEEKEHSLWPEHAYSDLKWGMAIDLTKCTGCQACMIACQAENNVPVVGREQVRRSRQMHWIRIDRYYSGDVKNPEVLFQPMLCQHCDNAPCETVCPVLATVHDNEGLNVQIYNRCVGTRYCQNNCPYKVRRFNFFDHWKSYEEPLNMVFNPDVTVRTRGIMEKCTFCLQRIKEVKDKAKDAKSHVQDGMMMTACQQTCPTQAISFGNTNDAQSQVSQWKKSPRIFHALEALNVKPVVSYMSKVRHKQEGF